MKSKDSQELETIDEILDNSEANINSEDNIDNNEGNGNIEDNIDKSESFSNLKNLNAQPSTFASSYRRPSITTSVPTPKRKKIAQVTSLVNEIRSIKDDLKNIPEYENNMPLENEHDIFGKFVASQLKHLSLTQCIMARDQINAVLSHCRLQDLNYGNTTFSFQTPFYNSSDSNMTSNSVPTSQTEGSILSTTEYQDNSNQENQINDINYDDSYNDNPIMRAFKDA
ncbi:hypothetical protein QTP88_010714 [Uroleucon formosanum]